MSEKEEDDTVRIFERSISFPKPEVEKKKKKKKRSNRLPTKRRPSRVGTYTRSWHRRSIDVAVDNQVGRLRKMGAPEIVIEDATKERDDMRKIVLRTVIIVALAGLMTIVLLATHPWSYHPESKNTNNNNKIPAPRTKEQQHQTVDNFPDSRYPPAGRDEPPQKDVAPLAEGQLSTSEERLAHLPQTILKEVLDICLYFSWANEQAHIDHLVGEDISFVQDKVTAGLLPTALTQTLLAHRDSDTTSSTATSSTSVALLRYTAMKGGLYPLTTTYAYDDDDSNDFDTAYIENMDERMLYALYVDELLEKMKAMELALQQQTQTSLRGSSMASVTANELTKFLDVAEALLVSHKLIHPEPASTSGDYDDDETRDVTVADVLLFSVGTRLAQMGGTNFLTDENRVVHELYGYIDMNKYRKVKQVMYLVATDPTVKAYFQHQQDHPQEQEQEQQQQEVLVVEKKDPHSAARTNSPQLTDLHTIISF